MQRFKTVIHESELDEVVQKDFEAGPRELSRQEVEAVLAQDRNNFFKWDARLAENNSNIIGYNKAMSQEQKQFGYVPGLSSGNGQLESRVSMHLFLALGASKFPDDKDWWKDDKKFYRFLREHPELDARPGRHKSQNAASLTREQLLA